MAKVQLAPASSAKTATVRGRGDGAAAAPVPNDAAIATRFSPAAVPATIVWAPLTATVLSEKNTWLPLFALRVLRPAALPYPPWRQKAASRASERTDTAFPLTVN